MAEFTARVGSDGRPAFAIPIAYSSHDPELLALDGIGFTAWLDPRGWTSTVLRSHLRYCLRDDYGCQPPHVSAWARLPSFAGRRRSADTGAHGHVVPLPEVKDRVPRQ